MRRVLPAVAALAVTTATLSCGGDGSRIPTSPPPVLSLTPQCNLARFPYVRDDILALFTGSELAFQQFQFDLMVAGGSGGECAFHPAGLVGTLMTMVDHSITVYRSGNLNDPNGSNSPTREEALVHYWNDVFELAGLDAPQLPTSVLSSEGAAQVIGDAGGDLENRKLTAGLRVPAGAVSFPHLFVIVPNAGTCDASTESQLGGCFEFKSFPHETAFPVPLTAVLCLADPDSRPEAVALGHQVNGVTMVPFPVPSPFPDLCPHTPVSVRDPGPSGNGWFATRLRSIHRLALRAEHAFSPTPVYAAHGGFGGGVEDLSPFVLLNLSVFRATFTNDALNRAPGAPSIGSWQVFAMQPGSVTVQSSLGAIGSKLAVLSQSAWGCGACPPAVLAARVASGTGGAPTYGKYSLRWTSVQNRANIAKAPVVIRDAAGRQIAVLAYTMNGMKRSLTFNGLVVGSWSQGMTQSFEVVVNLTLKKVTLSINGVQSITRNFWDPSASSLAQIAVELGALDGGVFGWDDVSVVRLPDA